VYRKKDRSHRLSFWARRASLYTILTLLSIAFIIPLIWMISTALKPRAQLFVYPPMWIPDPIMWGNFKEGLEFFPFWMYLRNTLYIAIFNVVGHVWSSSFIAYGFSRIEWPGRDKVFVLVLSTMMLPGTVTMIPTFLLWRNIGMVGVNKPLMGFGPLMIPSLLGGAFNIFLVRQFFMGIPQELSDAARIDGCSELRIYQQIMLPLAKPVLATVALFTFLGAWRDFMGPLIYLNSTKQYTLALGLRLFQTGYDVKFNNLMAASTVITAPIIVLFFLTQRTFIQGISLTGLKG
jgi:multiple sugar transport system permease protein